MDDHFAAPERFATDAFVIRSWLPGDGILQHEASSSSYEHLRTFMPWAEPDRTAADAEAYVRGARGRYLMATDFALGLFTPDETRVLGGSGFHLREGPLERRSAELGMWIRAEEARRGLGTSVLRALLRWGFSQWPWVRLAWRCDTRNVASVRVAEKAGMIREGTLRAHEVGADGSRRDTACFAALRGEWGDPVGGEA